MSVQIHSPGTLACLGGTPVADLSTEQRTLASKAEQARRYIVEAFDSGAWDDWPEVESQASLFAGEWAAFNNVPFCALITNGTHSLQLALEALDIGFGDEVIVPGITWQATASVVCDVNAVPILVDVDAGTLCIDPQRVREAITDRTRAVIPVHLYHRMADLDALTQLCSENDLHLIEDAAHAHGSRWGGRNAGSIGTFGSFSFQRSKMMNAGEGGALITSDEELYGRVMSLRSCGRRSESGAKVHSGNYRMTSFQAAVLRAELSALKDNADELDRRGRALDQYIDQAPGVQSLYRHPNLTRQCSYGFAFLYDAQAYGDIPAAIFRSALSAELGVMFGSCYEPLNHSPYYFPHTKRRHHISDRYVDAITPDRFDLPVAEALWRDRIVQTHWPIFQLPPERAAVVGDAVAKIYEHRRELCESDE